MTSIQRRLLERFLRYSAIPTESKAGSNIIPSSEGQMELALLLKKELEGMGLHDILLTRDAILTARLKGNRDGKKKGWICHLDTKDISLSPSVHPMLVEDYDGKDVEQKRGRISVNEHPELQEYMGKDILFSDGRSVLGADDKAAISIVMEALSILTSDPTIPHSDIFVAFVPDEEIGLKGAKAMDAARFPVDWGYTIDCCRKGEVVWETFNAGEAKVTIHGVTAHPMSAKGVMVNPILAANDFISLFSPAETPECTEGKEGYIWINNIQGDASVCTVFLNIRDHNREKYNEKKEKILLNAQMTREKYPKATIEVEVDDTYSNIIESVNEENRDAIDTLREALKENGIKEIPLSMRGGTDGSFISTKGILVPNYFTGAHNFHSTAEFWPLEDGEASLMVTLSLMKCR
ncbi:MAG: peptidase T [Candidatus Ornithospirochaeta sp.]